MLGLPLESFAQTYDSAPQLLKALEERDYDYLHQAIPTRPADQLRQRQYPWGNLGVTGLEYRIRGEKLRLRMELALPNRGLSFDTPFNKQLLDRMVGRFEGPGPDTPIFDIHSTSRFTLFGTDETYRPWHIKLVDEDPRTIGIEDAHIELEWLVPLSLSREPLGIIMNVNLSPVTAFVSHSFPLHQHSEQRWTTSAWVKRKLQLEEKTRWDWVLDFEYPSQDSDGFERFRDQVSWSMFPPDLNRAEFETEWERIGSYQARLKLRKRHNPFIPKEARLELTIPFYDRPQWDGFLAYGLPPLIDVLEADK